MTGMSSVLAFLYPAATPRVDYRVENNADGTGEHIGYWNTAGLGAQPTEASLATTQASAAYQTYISQPAIDQRHRDETAAALPTNALSTYQAARAGASVLVDELNVIREWIMSFKAATAAATNLATLQSAVAALPNLPDRTLAQAKSAIQTKITNGTAD